MQRSTGQVIAHGREVSLTRPSSACSSCCCAAAATGSRRTRSRRRPATAPARPGRDRAPSCGARPGSVAAARGPQGARAALLPRRRRGRADRRLTAFDLQQIVSRSPSAPAAAGALLSDAHPACRERRERLHLQSPRPPGHDGQLLIAAAIGAAVSVALGVYAKRARSDERADPPRRVPVDAVDEGVADDRRRRARASPRRSSAAWMWGRLPACAARRRAGSPTPTAGPGTAAFLLVAAGRLPLPVVARLAQHGRPGRRPRHPRVRVLRRLHDEAAGAAHRRPRRGGRCPCSAARSSPILTGDLADVVAVVLHQRRLPGAREHDGPALHPHPRDLRHRRRRHRRPARPAARRRGDPGAVAAPARSRRRAAAGARSRSPTSPSAQPRTVAAGAVVQVSNADAEAHT